MREWLNCLSNSASFRGKLARSQPSWRLDVTDHGQLTPTPGIYVCSCKFWVISKGLVQEINVKSTYLPHYSSIKSPLSAGIEGRGCNWLVHNEGYYPPPPKKKNEKPTNKEVAVLREGRDPTRQLSLSIFVLIITFFFQSPKMSYPVYLAGIPV